MAACRELRSLGSFRDQARREDQASPGRVNVGGLYLAENGCGDGGLKSLKGSSGCGVEPPEVDKHAQED